MSCGMAPTNLATNGEAYPRKERFNHPGSWLDLRCEWLRHPKANHSATNSVIQVPSVEVQKLPRPKVS